MQNHTPGPWYARPIYSNGGEVHSARGIICDASIGLSERQEYRDAHRAESEANARLIAAAPDMLQALELAIRCLKCHAIDCHRDGLPNAAASADRAVAATLAALAKATN